MKIHMGFTSEQILKAIDSIIENQGADIKHKYQAEIAIGIALATLRKELEKEAAHSALQQPSVEDEIERFDKWWNDGVGKEKQSRPAGTEALVAYWAQEAWQARAALSPTAGQRPTDDRLWDETLEDRDRYHDMADKLAGSIAKHFNVDIGEHSNQNCPWQEDLEVIESAAGQSNTALEEARADLEWHKASLERHVGKLHSVWEGIKEAVEKYSRKPCDGEPFDRLYELLEFLRAASDNAGQQEIETLRAERDELARQLGELTHSDEGMRMFRLLMERDALQKKLDAGQQAIPEGWKLVPIEPTQEMQAAGEQAVRLDTTVLNRLSTGNAVFRAMISASPTPEGDV